MEYSAGAAICNDCHGIAQCTSSKRGRQLHRSFYADYLERVKGYHQTSAYQKAIDKRKVWVEPLFAEAKEWHGMRRFRLRRLWRVNCEALVTASGQNLKRLLQKRGWGRRPFSTEAVMAVPPPNWEADEAPRHQMRKSSRPSIAVASLISWGAIGAFFEPRKSIFSPVMIVYSYFSYFGLYVIFTSITCFAYISLFQRVSLCRQALALL